MFSPCLPPTEHYPLHPFPLHLSILRTQRKMVPCTHGNSLTRLVSIANRWVLSPFQCCQKRSPPPTHTLTFIGPYLYSSLFFQLLSSLSSFLVVIVVISVSRALSPLRNANIGELCYRASCSLFQFSPPLMF